MRKLTIAFDYGGTWTEDPEGWSIVYHTLISRGHRCIMVSETVEGQNEDMSDVIQLFGKENVYYSAWFLKSIWMWRHNVKVDIWIDDRPQLIARNS